MQETESSTRKNLTDIVGAPYVFHLKDGTPLEIGEWTLDSEVWAKKHYGSMENLFKILMKIECEDEDTIDAAIRVAIFKLTPDSKAVVRDKINEFNAKIKELNLDTAENDPFAEEETENDQSSAWIYNVRQFFSRFITYAQLSGLVSAEHHMIKDSIPVEALEEVKKSHMKMLTDLQGTKAGQRQAKKKKTTKKKPKSR